jgi:GAF domain-containing protein
MPEAAQALREAATLEEVHRVIRTTARALARADGATFVLLDGDQCYYADEDSMSPLWKGQRFPAAACISGWSMTHRQTVVIGDIRVDERIPQAAYRPTFVRSLVMTPILAPEAVGAIGVYWASRFLVAPVDIPALESLASAAAVALRRFPEGIPAPGVRL